MVLIFTAALKEVSYTVLHFQGTLCVCVCVCVRVRVCVLEGRGVAGECQREDSSVN